MAHESLGAIVSRIRRAGRISRRMRHIHGASTYAPRCARGHRPLEKSRFAPTSRWFPPGDHFAQSLRHWQLAAARSADDWPTLRERTRLRAGMSTRKAKPLARAVPTRLATGASTGRRAAANARRHSDWPSEELARQRVGWSGRPAVLRLSSRAYRLHLDGHRAPVPVQHGP